MNDLTITETCACGATFKASGYGISVRTAVDAWRESHKHAESVGICGDRPEVAGFPDHLPRPYCALKAGHAGMHGDGDGGHWTARTDHPDETTDTTSQEASK